MERQAATGDCLEVISGSPRDLQPVFATMLENAVRICDANPGNIYRWDGGRCILASHNTPPAFAEVVGVLRIVLIRYSHRPYGGQQNGGSYQ